MRSDAEATLMLHIRADAAMRLGWTVYRCSQHMVRAGYAVETIAILVEQAIEQRNQTAPA